MRLIDADELRGTIENEHFGEYEDKETAFYCIDTAHTLDAVVVVRCKDCKYHDKGEGYIYCWALHMKCPDGSEFFCKYGERKEAKY